MSATNMKPVNDLKSQIRSTFQVMSDTPRTDARWCPHCGSDRDTVLKSKMWACGVYFSDPPFRTKSCVRRELAAAHSRIKQLESEARKTVAEVAEVAEVTKNL